MLELSIFGAKYEYQSLILGQNQLEILDNFIYIFSFIGVWYLDFVAYVHLGWYTVSLISPKLYRLVPGI
ncbi:MAG: hypothetical protein RL185_750 [Bacteroidota bacterium]|jgi:hypothetical protein